MCVKSMLAFAALYFYLLNFYLRFQWINETSLADPVFGDDLNVYDPNNLVWQDLSIPTSGTPPTVRCFHGFASTSGKLYVHGGLTIEYTGDFLEVNKVNMCDSWILVVMCLRPIWFSYSNFNNNLHGFWSARIWPDCFGLDRPLFCGWRATTKGRSWICGNTAQTLCAWRLLGYFEWGR